MGVLEQLVRGAGVGAVNVADPIGAVINHTDRWISGAGPSDRERAISTVSAAAYQQFFLESEEALSFWSAYVPRFGGKLIGGFGAAAGLYGAGVATAALTGAPVWVGATAIPGMLGIYGAARALGRYVHDYVKGERIGGSLQKSSFWQGIKYGYHQATHLPAMLRFHDLESGLTGRGFDTSHTETSIAGSGYSVRRNFRTLLGSLVGATWGALVSVATLGIVPLYKSIRDWGRSAGIGKAAKRDDGPAHISHGGSPSHTDCGVRKATSKVLPPDYSWLPPAYNVTSLPTARAVQPNQDSAYQEVA